MFSAHGKISPTWPQMGLGGFFPTNQDLADNLGRTDWQSENLHFLDFLDSIFPDSWIPRFLEFPVLILTYCLCLMRQSEWIVPTQFTLCIPTRRFDKPRCMQHTEGEHVLCLQHWFSECCPESDSNKICKFADLFFLVCRQLCALYLRVRLWDGNATMKLPQITCYRYLCTASSPIR